MVSRAIRGIGISRLHFPVETLGPGRRAGVWLQGCSLHCAGCLSRDTWAPATSLTDPEAVADWTAAQAGTGLTGITVSGGEPLDQPAALEELLTAFRARPQLADADVLIYTGYAYGVLARRHPVVLTLADAVISGPYVRSRPSSHPWMGSGNQVLTVLTERGADRLRQPASSPRLQVSADGGKLWLTGIPAPGDLDRLAATLAQQGIRLEDMSWRP
jgi:anaerobic ribonucleoside-triphosphate reductase activating protein